MRRFIACLFILAGPLLRAADSADVTAVKAVLSAYKNGLEKLDVSEAAKFFSEDSLVFESGGAEGNSRIISNTTSAPSWPSSKSSRSAITPPKCGSTLRSPS